MEEDALCEEPKEALIMTIELSRLDAINNLLQRVEYKHEMSILILRKTASSHKLRELPSAASPKKLPLLSTSAKKDNSSNRIMQLTLCGLENCLKVVYLLENYCIKSFTLK